MSTLTIIHVNCEIMFSTFKSFFQPLFGCAIQSLYKNSHIVKLNFCGSQSQSNSREVETKGSTMFISANQHLHSKFYMFCKTSQGVLWDAFPFVSTLNQILKFWKFGKRFEVSYYYELGKLGKSQWNVELPIKELFCYCNTFLVCITSFKGL